MKFQDRADAGKQLAQKLMKYKNVPDTLVIGLPRGGMVVAEQVAQLLELPLDVKVVRKIGSPSNAQLVVGALTASGTTYLNEPLMKTLGITIETLTPSIEAEKKEALRKLHAYRPDREAREIKDKTIILVDDGISSGATMHAAILAVKMHGAKKIIVAVPIASQEQLINVGREVDEVICLEQPSQFIGIGLVYDNFAPVSDDDVAQIMQQ